MIDWRANARAAIEFAARTRRAHAALRILDPVVHERLRLGLGRLLRWADERARS